MDKPVIVLGHYPIKEYASYKDNYSRFYDSFLTIKYRTKIDIESQGVLEQLLPFFQSQNDPYVIVLSGFPASGCAKLRNELEKSLFIANTELKVSRSGKRTQYKTLIDGKNQSIILWDLSDESNTIKDLQGENIYREYHEIVATTEKIPILFIVTKDVRDPAVIKQLQRLYNNEKLKNRVFICNYAPQSTQKDDLSKYSRIIDKLTNTSSEAAIFEIYNNYSEVIYGYGYGAEFSKSLIIPKREIIVPKPEIISGITLVNDSLLQQARRNPEIMYRFSPREFEEMVCELFDKQGFRVNLTKQTHDGGKDLIVLKKDALGEFCVYMDCKKYRPDRPVGVGLVRELYGTVEADRVTAGRIVTTSYFSDDAKEFTETVKYRMSLMDFDAIVKALEGIS